MSSLMLCYINTLRPRQNVRHFPDDIFKCIFMNGNIWIAIKILLKIVSKVPINNIPALVQIMAWRRPGDKPLYEPMLVSLLTHICVTRPQWVETDPVSDAQIHTYDLRYDIWYMYVFQYWAGMRIFRFLHDFVYMYFMSWILPELR